MISQRPKLRSINLKGNLAGAGESPEIITIIGKSKVTIILRKKEVPNITRSNKSMEMKREEEVIEAEGKLLQVSKTNTEIKQIKRQDTTPVNMLKVQVTKKRD